MQSIARSFSGGFEELRQSSTAWLEVALAMFALISGLYVGWPINRPYVSAFYPAFAGWVAIAAGALFVAQGAYQGVIAFFLLRESERRNYAARWDAAASGAGVWAMASWLLLADLSPGWMTMIAPLCMLFQVFVWKILSQRQRRRETDI